MVRGAVTVNPSRDPTQAVSADRRRLPRPTMLWLTIALVAVPFVAVIISLVGHPWHPSGDQAVELLRIQDVGGRHTPLLGASSRWGWAHPGPLLFWSLTPFDRVLGANGMLVGTAIINLASVVGFVVVAYRRGGDLGALIGGFTVLLVARGDRSRLVDRPVESMGGIPAVRVLPGTGLADGLR